MGFSNPSFKLIQARHQFFYWKLETRRECYLHPHHLILGIRKPMRVKGLHQFCYSPSVTLHSPKFPRIKTSKEIQYLSFLDMFFSTRCSN